MTEIINPRQDQADSLPQTAEATIGGRQVVVRKPTQSQFAIIDRLERIADRAERKGQALSEDDEDGKFALFREALSMQGKALDILISLAVDDDDREWLEDQVLTGKLDLPDFTVLIQAFIPADAERKPKPAKKVTAANPARTRR
jgi:hypothetical protein